jgi:ketosteroid isomerase-like protein
MSAVDCRIDRMSEVGDPARLGSVFVEAINAGDLDGVMRCYDDCAVLELPDGGKAVGRDSIREFYAELLVSRPRLQPGEQAPALVYGDVALTSTRVGSTATAEVAKRQADGGWRWVIDRPNVLLDRS